MKLSPIGHSEFRMTVLGNPKNKLSQKLGLKRWGEKSKALLGLIRLNQ
jgi:hypothetical protein